MNNFSNMKVHWWTCSHYLSETKNLVVPHQLVKYVNRIFQDSDFIVLLQTGVWSGSGCLHLGSGLESDSIKTWVRTPLVFLFGSGYTSAGGDTVKIKRWVCHISK